MNFRRTRNQRHVTCRNPPRRRCGPDRPPLLAPRCGGGAGTRCLVQNVKEQCGRLPHSNVYSRKRVAEPWIPSTPPPFPFRAWIREYIFPVKFQWKIRVQRLGRPHKSVCYTSRTPELIDMKRLLVVAGVMTFAATELFAAAVGGRVSFVTKRGQNPIVNETLIWLEPAAGVRTPKRAPATFTMTTRGKALLPHVLAIPIGSTVNFPNEDPISHNLFSLSSANSFDLGLYRTGAGKSHTFATPGVVNVYCNVHPNMSAVIHVMPTPFYGFADAAGNFSLPDVAPGKYEM